MHQSLPSSSVVFQVCTMSVRARAESSFYTYIDMSSRRIASPGRVILELSHHHHHHRFVFRSFSSLQCDKEDARRRQEEGKELAIYLNLITLAKYNQPSRPGREEERKQDYPLILCTFPGSRSLFGRLLTTWQEKQSVGRKGDSHNKH